MAEIIRLADRRQADTPRIAKMPVDLSFGRGAREALIDAVRSLPDDASRRADRILLELASRGYIVILASDGILT